MSDYDDSDVMMSMSDESTFIDSDVEQVTTKKKAAPKTKAAPKRSVLGDSNAQPKSKSNNKKTVEETFQKLTQIEHILVRPDTYSTFIAHSYAHPFSPLPLFQLVGSILPHTEKMFVLSNERIVEKEITYVPGLYKIFDEIVVNAADNKQRDPSMDKLDINIENEQITIKNNGKGIPVQMHSEHGVYVPTLIFGHLLTGSNFDDDEKKTTGGRNGCTY